MRNVLRAVQLLFRQFPFLAALRMLIAEAARKVFDPYGVLSYGQTGEDCIIAALLGTRSAGFYVDVGCHHPYRLSNTLRLYKHGWTGLVIDGNPQAIQLFRKFRPRDTGVCAVVSDHRAKVTFSVDLDEPAISTIASEPPMKDGPNFGASAIRDVQVQTVTLEELFVQYCVPAQFDLLSIDVETHNLEALRSFDLSSFRPRLIVVETDADVDSRINGAVQGYLGQRGYRRVAYALRNAYFVRDQDSREN